MTSTPAAPNADRLYFRQLLSGLDLAEDDPVAQQMVNFVYAIGDRAAGQCLLVDPAYAVSELLDSVRCHVQEEETEIFPRLRAACDPLMLERLGADAAGYYSVDPLRRHAP